MTPPARQQGSLSFGAAEGSRNERRNTIGLAVAKLFAAKQRAADAVLRDFLIWIFNVEESTGGPLVKSYRELGCAPWGLMCSFSKAYQTVTKAKWLGFITVEPRKSAALGYAANAYRINWPGIHSFLNEEVPPHILAKESQLAAEVGSIAGKQPYSSSSLLLPLKEEEPPPPTPAPTGAGDASASLPWDEVEVVLRPILANAVGTLDIAKKRGLPPQHVLALARYYVKHADRWKSPGVLHWRIRNASPQEADAASGWPPPAASYLANQAEQARARERERLLAASREEASQRELDSSRKAHLRELWDSLSAERQAAVVASMRADEANRFLRRLPDHSPSVLVACIAQLEREMEVAS